ncbi:hypothetical protein FQN51_002038 [Onygenales sp. PD_10]|nr:hypothetical protein FQN51_002038 [Onygenales sp. PD_10]
MLEDIADPTGAAAAPPPTHAITTTTTTTTTSSLHRAKHLYFAYGSNLSHSQMRQRCPFDPAISSKPLAIARLDGWKWIICERGYANVLAPKRIIPSSSGVGAGILQESDNNETGNKYTEEQVQEQTDVVYGVLYNMTPADEAVLDRYEGIDRAAPPTSSPDGPVGRGTRPREQGDGAYNKWYVRATVVKWLNNEGGDGEEEEGRGAENGLSEANVLVYVDEYRVTEGLPKEEYIGRMNRGIKEAEELGLPRDWVEGVVRRFIPDGPGAGEGVIGVREN